MQKAVPGKYNNITGKYVTTPRLDEFCCLTKLDDLRPSKRANLYIVALPAPEVYFKEIDLLYYDESETYLGHDSYTEVNGIANIKIEKASIYKDAYYVACSFKIDITNNELRQMTSVEITSMLTKVWFYVGFRLQEPHYSSLKSKFKKETSQIFFRNSLEGTVKIYGADFDFINSQDIETKYLFAVTKPDYSVLAINSFAKTDCKLDITKHCIQLKLSAIDKYSNIMDKYDNTYDLIKLSPAITQLTLTKRLLYQFYIQGADSVSCYANGTHWEQDVTEPIDDADALVKKYFFAKNSILQEITVDIADSEYFAGTYIRLETVSEYEYMWMNISNNNLIIRFKALTSSEKSTYGTDLWPYGGILGAATGTHPLNTAGESADTLYWIYFEDTSATSQQVTPNLKSKYVYCTSYTSEPFEGIFSSESYAVYNMKKESDGTEVFSLRDTLIDYVLWCRILADVDSVKTSEGDVNLYDLPKDDFVTERVNYKKCIGLIGLNAIQSSRTVKYPTKYGRTDYGDYFTSNVVDSSTRTQHMPIPICKSFWANTSIWAVIPDDWSTFESRFRKSFTLKDAFSLADVIKAMLHKIDPLIKFEATDEYSQFFYGGVSPIPYDTARARYVPFIAPKSNVLKGNYDQAAQKAEITFEQLMDMLRNCFRCFWYIDSSNRLRIEHISYFMKGLSYSKPNIQLDLTDKYDKFNKKAVLYSQEEVSYNKDELCSRYEFSWMDETTDIFEDIEIDISSVYTQSDNTEEINSEAFSTDIDLMLYAPDKFSEDGFALMMADMTSHRVPFLLVQGLRDDEYMYTYRAEPQNYLCSWLYLARYYRLDMPAYNITYTRAPETDEYEVIGIKQSKQQDIEFQTDIAIDLNKAIKTTIGTGMIEELSINIDTNFINATLNYELK